MNRLLEQSAPACPEEPPSETRNFYLRSLALLDQANIPFLIGGGYAMSHYTGIIRHTKDLDVFCRPADCDRILDVLAEEGVIAPSEPGRTSSPRPSTATRSLMSSIARATACARSTMNGSTIVPTARSGVTPSPSARSRKPSGAKPTCRSATDSTGPTSPT